MSLSNAVDWLNDIYPNGFMNQFFYLLFTGVPTNTTIGTLLV